MDCRSWMMELPPRVAYSRNQTAPESQKEPVEFSSFLFLLTELESVCMVEGPLRFRTANGLDWSTGSSLKLLLLYEEAAAFGVRLIITGEVAMPFFSSEDVRRHFMRTSEESLSISLLTHSPVHPVFAKLYGSRRMFLLVNRLLTPLQVNYPPREEAPFLYRLCRCNEVDKSHIELLRLLEV